MRRLRHRAPRVAALAAATVVCGAFTPRARAELTSAQRDEYTRLLTRGATAGLFVDHALRYVQPRGFRVVDLGAERSRGEKWSAGERLAFVNRGRTLLLAVVGTKPMSEGVRLLGAHIDTPHLRVALDAAVETAGFVALRATPYGGIKDYQWESRALQLVGHVFTGAGTRKTFEAGTAAPRFVVSPIGASAGGAPPPVRRLQWHSRPVLALATSLPVPAGLRKTKAPLAAFYHALHARLGVTREELRTSELALVPAQAPIAVGLDRALIAGHGQDDRACAIPSMMALADLDLARPPAFTALALLVDREEIGSTGVTGARSAFLDRALSALLRGTGQPSNTQAVRETWARTEALSADVNAGVNPLFAGVHELRNASRVGGGLAVTKFTGSRGKRGASEADAETTARLVQRLQRAGVPLHVGLLGRVNEGGGGTIAQDLASRGIRVLDVGVPVVSMHSPFELVAWRDLGAMYRAARAFWTEP